MLPRSWSEISTDKNSETCYFLKKWGIGASGPRFRRPGLWRNPSDQSRYVKVIASQCDPTLEMVLPSGFHSQAMFTWQVVVGSLILSYYCLAHLLFDTTTLKQRR